MGINDVLKDSVMEMFQVSLSLNKVLGTFFAAAILGVYLYFVYRTFSKSSFYSKDFNLTLAILPIITSGIMLAMQSSVVISLGMVGALSIVRFRNAVKNSMDLMFLFWSISVGIIVGAGVYDIALFLSLIVTVLLTLLNLAKMKKPSYLLVIHAEQMDYQSDLSETVNKHCKHSELKSVSLSNGHLDVIVEIKTMECGTLLNELSSNPKVKCVNIVSHEGEIKV